jgi:hypothetical protein
LLNRFFWPDKGETMYYEEVIKDGNRFCRTSPGGDFKPVSVFQEVPDDCQIMPKQPTPEILAAMRAGSSKDLSSDELCRARYAAMLAAATPIR